VFLHLLEVRAYPELRLGNSSADRIYFLIYLNKIKMLNNYL